MPSKPIYDHSVISVAPPAVTPAEAAKLNDAQDHAAFHAAVLKINEHLKKLYRTGERVEISDSVIGSGKVVDQVVAHFRSAGWHIEAKNYSDPREPYSCFVFSA